MPNHRILIKRGKQPKPRRRWARSPVSKIKESGKKYRRGKAKREAGKAIENGKT